MSIPFAVKEATDLTAVYEAKGSATLKVNGADFRVNGGPIQKLYNYTQAFTLGETITLTATGENFLYWMNESDKIVTTSAEYSFVIVGKTSLTAVYKYAGENSAYVEFVSDYNQIMQAQNYDASSKILMPTGPSKSGYTFVRWNMTADEIRTSIQNGETYIRVKPVYEAKEGTFELKVVYDEGTTVTQRVDGYQFYTVSALSMAGRKFAYWKDENGTILGTQNEYHAYVERDETLYAVYVDPEDETEIRPIVAVTNIAAAIEDNKNKLNFSVTWDIPDGYTLNKYGALRSTDSKYGGEDAEKLMIVNSSESNLKDFSSDTLKTLYGEYTYTLGVSNASVDLRVYVRGYIVITNDNGETLTVYSPIVSTTFNEAYTVQ